MMRHVMNLLITFACNDHKIYIAQIGLPMGSEEDLADLGLANFVTKHNGLLHWRAKILRIA